jgi:hypothetical protein
MVRALGLTALALLLLSPPAHADQDAIDRAIERGVTRLKKMQQADGTWPHEQIGATALAGLTLLECGVPPSDPAVRKAADAVRKASVALTHTYSLSLAVLFLDRLGEEADVPIIESLAVRLLAGQNGNGGWTYNCPPIAESEARRLTRLLKQRNELVTRKPSEGGAADQRKLTDEIRQQIEVINRDIERNPDRKKDDDDNSNTQFAVLALWAARRHGVPADPALGLINARYRVSQNGDGGWGYKFRAYPPDDRKRDGKSTATMTAAGLLGLATVYGAVAEARLRTEKPEEGAKPVKVPEPTGDPAVRAALIALGTAIDHPVAKKKGKAVVPKLEDGGRAYYFLWSLERVGVAFGLKTIGGKDWHAWGSEVLVASQGPGGGWKGDYADSGADTCFALLFLRRSNLARDLSTVLRGKVEDPGEVTLTAGGVGGGNLAQRSGLKPALDERTAAARDLDPEAARLSRELTEAAPARRPALIEQLRDGKGGLYTDALADAAARLDGEAKKQAREALAERLTRMTAATLGDKLSDEVLEVRRAAALAAAMKDDRTHVPRLIEMLDDPEPPVARAAYAALRSLTGQDFGPAADASRADKAKAMAAWKGWWARQGRP